MQIVRKASTSPRKDRPLAHFARVGLTATRPDSIPARVASLVDLGSTILHLEHRRALGISLSRFGITGGWVYICRG